MKVLVYDTETTGLPIGRNPSIYNSKLWPHIVQLSYILYDTDKKKPLVSHDWIIKIPDDVEISEGSFKLHGISKDISKTEGVDIDVALDNFDICLSRADEVVGHNTQFDKKMVIVENIRNRRDSGFKTYKNKEYCTMHNSKELCAIKKKSSTGETYFKYPTQTELHKKLFNTIPNGVHNSWNDILICLRNYYKLKYNEDLYKKSSRFKREYKCCI